ncbi:MAG TPA: protein kinase [Candidatus Sulfotelmatobacter sp.]|nr:protein kinase [Candidatus Sulfotelmatobacter sp.]
MPPMAHSDSLIERTVSHYRILEKLGAGGMGVVYKAEDTRLHRFVALKFLPENVAHDPQMLERFRREARSASALNHAGICTIYDVGEEDGLAFIAMEFIDGVSLRDLLRGLPLPLSEILRIGIQIADALEFAHAEQIVHRDIKPANILVTKRGQAKILDFGLAKLIRKGFETSGNDRSGEAAESTTTIGIIHGTPSYMSPEQVRGDNLDARTDIFSFGLLLYEMATGRRAYSGGTGGMIIEAVLTRSPDPVRTINPEISPQLEAIIAKALQKDRDQRYQSAADIAADLNLIARESDSGPRSAAGISISRPAAAGSFQSDAQTANNSTPQSGAMRSTRVSRVIDSLAVLPFENATLDPEHEYLSDGIAASLINTLATVPRLRVMAQSTVFRYKGRRVDAQTVGRELNVRAVLMGRIMQSGESLRIGTELVDVASGSQLWGAQYDRKSGEIFAIQDDISEEISSKLKLKLTRAEKNRLTKRTTKDAEAYRLYLKGRHHWNRWTEDGFYKAIEYFENAVEQDLTYALASAGIADTYVLLGWNGYLPPNDAFPKAKAASMRALRLDPDLGEARISLAAVLWLYDWKWQEAHAEFKRSLALNPAYPTGNHWYAEFLMTMGLHAEAVERMKDSQELDPLSLIISVAIAWAHYMGRHYDEALAQLHRTIEMEPNYPVTHWILGLLLRKLGRFDEAVVAGEMGVKLSGGSSLMNAALAQTFAAAGSREKALSILHELTAASGVRYVSPYYFAGIQVGLGEADRAIDYLEKAYAERSHWIIYLHIDPGLDALRPDPRFQDILRRIGLPLTNAISA